MTDDTELLAEIARLKRWVDDLQSGMYINCVYCGHRYGPVEDTPVAMSKVLYSHILTCEEHPVSTAMKQLREYGDHKVTCMVRRQVSEGKIVTARCNCGWETISAALRTIGSA